MKKKTDDLVNEIVESENIARYLNSNEDEFLKTSFHIYLRELLEKSGLKVSQIVDASCQGEYIYKVFRGVKNPGRDVMLSISLAMKLDSEEVRHLLRIAHLPSLDARNRRDSIIMFALNKKLTVPDTNDILYQFDEKCL